MLLPTHIHVVKSFFIFIPATLWFNFWDFQGTIRPTLHWGFPDCSVIKNLPASAGKSGSISGSGRFPWGRNGNPLQYSCLENPMDSRLHSMGSQRVGYDSATKKQQSLHLSPYKVELLTKFSLLLQGIAHLSSVRGHTKQRRRGGVKPLSSVHVTFLILRKECPRPPPPVGPWGQWVSIPAVLQKAQLPPRSAAQLQEWPGKVVHFLETPDWQWLSWRKVSRAQAWCWPGPGMELIAGTRLPHSGVTCNLSSSCSFTLHGY